MSQPLKVSFLRSSPSSETQSGCVCLVIWRSRCKISSSPPDVLKAQWAVLMSLCIQSFLHPLSVWIRHRPTGQLSVPGAGHYINACEESIWHGKWMLCGPFDGVFALVSDPDIGTQKGNQHCGMWKALITTLSNTGPGLTLCAMRKSWRGSSVSVKQMDTNWHKADICVKRQV